MARLFQSLWSPNESDRAGGISPAHPPQDDDLVLGWECANPALQCDGWEPAPLLPQAGATAC